MQMKFHIGTKVLFGRFCLKDNKQELEVYGKKALIVTGKSSGSLSGALNDVIEVLMDLGIEYRVFDKAENNPSLENVSIGGKAAAEFQADFIIGIGGGSPLDAAKAIAVLAVNDIEPLDLYKNSFENKPLPIIAIPTTAGTGSEVTPYSILSRKDMQTKMSFGNPDTFPKLAFIDARYTENLPYDITVNTAVDAFSHSVEGYLGRRSAAISDTLAEKSIELFGECLESLISGNMDFSIREKLLYMSMLGGMVIAHTGTTIVHGMGYSLTYFKEVPHGKANGLLMKEYFKYNYEYAKEKIDRILELIKVNDIDDFGDLMGRLIKNDIKFDDGELKSYAAIAMKQRSTAQNIRAVSEQDLVEIMRKSLM